VPMSTYQDTNRSSPDALVLGYQVRDHHLPNRPPLAQADTYAAALPARRWSSRVQLGSSQLWCITTACGGSGPWCAVHRNREAPTVRPLAVNRP